MDAGALYWGLNLAFKTLCLAVLVLTSVWSLRRSSSAFRHRLLALFSTLAVLMPVAGFVLPAWSLELIVMKSAAEPSGQIGTGVPVAAEGLAWLQILFWIWLAGCVILLILLSAGRLSSFGMLRRATAVCDEELIALLDKLSRRLSLRKQVRLLTSKQVKVPVITGSLQPSLILSEQAEKWPPERLEAILIHELAHIKRGDVLSQTLAQLACCLHWYNPLVWVAERRQMIERERACDDLVLSSGKKASEYARHLMDSASSLGVLKNPAWAIAAMTEGTDFKDRLLSILDPNARRTGVARAVSIGFGLSALLLLGPLSAARPFTWSAPLETGPSVSGVVGKAEEADKSMRDRLGDIFDGLGEVIEAQAKVKNQGRAIRRMVGSIGGVIKSAHDQEKAKKSIAQLFFSIGELVLAGDDSEEADKPQHE